MAYRLTITNGPSKWDLMLALFDGDVRHRRTVTFSLEDPAPQCDHPGIPDLDFVINGIQREDVSGELWLLEGYYPGFNRNRPMRGCFNTQTRRGWLEF